MCCNRVTYSKTLHGAFLWATLGQIRFLKFTKMHYSLDSVKKWNVLSLHNNLKINNVQANLVICGLFICEFTYMRLRMIFIYRTYPLIYSHAWSFYMQICYMRVIFYGPYLSHITRSACDETFNEVYINHLLTYCRIQ
jgi:hypothetical protein